MSLKYEKVRGKHVRLLSNAYARLLLPLAGYTGTIEGQRTFKESNRTEYLFVPDARFHLPADMGSDFYVFDDEFEVMDAAAQKSQ
jgi:hypothetical protein